MHISQRHISVNINVGEQ